MVRHRENGNQDPRGNGPTTDANGQPGPEAYEKPCPFCGGTMGNRPDQHLPCDGTESGGDA